MTRPKAHEKLGCETGNRTLKEERSEVVKWWLMTSEAAKNALCTEREILRGAHPRRGDRWNINMNEQRILSLKAIVGWSVSAAHQAAAQDSAVMWN